VTADQQTPTGDRVRWLGVGLILGPLLTRAMTIPARAPYFDFTDPADPTGGMMLPHIALLLDTLIWIGVCLCLSRRARSGGEAGLRWGFGLALLVGALGVALHTLVLTPFCASGIRGDLRALEVMSPWLAAFAGAWGLLHVVHDRTLWRTLVATTLGLLLMLAFRGGYEVFVQHPENVERFEENPAQMLGQLGLEPESDAARLFERRLRKANPRAWFGLANVFASVVAALTVAWALLAIGGWRTLPKQRQGVAGLWTLIALAGMAALVMAGSKGGYAALAAGLATAAAARFLPRLTRWLLVLAPVGVTGLILVRGLLGNALNEISLLFRFHYLQAVPGIVAMEPLTGVGPGGFKTAYGLAKPLENPEFIESAHHAFADWLAMLGLFGLGFAVMWIALLWWAGRSALRLPAATDRTAPQRAGLGGVLIAVLATAAALLIGGPRAPDDLAALLIALGLWCLAVRTIAATGTSIDRWLVLGLIGAAGTLSAHVAMEVTLYNASSVGVAVVLAALAVGPIAGVARRRGAVPLSRGVAVIGALLHATGTLGLTILSMGSLRPGLAFLAEIRDPSNDRPDLYGLELSITPMYWNHASGDINAQGSDTALALAARMRDARPNDAAEALDLALNAALNDVGHWHRRPDRWMQLARVHLTRHALLGDDDSLAEAEQAVARATELDPKALRPHAELAKLRARLGDVEGAADAAERALAISAAAHLDPLAQLRPEKRALLEAIAARGLPDRAGAIAPEAE
jgi:tetratricopeptide (TPR) repeat protein